jgi:hypothetical protein
MDCQWPSEQLASQDIGTYSVVGLDMAAHRHRGAQRRVLRHTGAFTSPRPMTHSLSFVPLISELGFNLALPLDRYRTCRKGASDVSTSS